MFWSVYAQVRSSNRRVVPIRLSFNVALPSEFTIDHVGTELLLIATALLSSGNFC